MLRAYPPNMGGYILALAVWCSIGIAVLPSRDAARGLATEPIVARIAEPIVEPEPQSKPPIPMRATDDSALLRMHAAYLKHFVRQPGFGVTRVRSPRLIKEEGLVLAVEVDGEQYRIWRRLIGTSEHDQARLYNSMPLGPMSHPVKDMDSAEIDQTDAAALERLPDGVEVLIASDRSRVLGAVRARSECVRCHEVEEGTLLGALRYDLSPILR